MLHILSKNKPLIFRDEVGNHFKNKWIVELCLQKNSIKKVFLTLSPDVEKASTTCLDSLILSRIKKFKIHFNGKD